MKKFKDFKKEVETKIEEKKEENTMKEKKPMPKWLKVTGGTVLGAAALGVAYLFGKSKGGKVSSEVEDETDDSEEEIYDEDLEDEEN